MSAINKSTRIFVATLKHVIPILEKERRQYAPGNVAYTCQGIRPIELDSEGVTGTLHLWVDSAHEQYKQITDDIQVIEDWIEALMDAPAKIDRQTSFLDGGSSND